MKKNIFSFLYHKPIFFAKLAKYFKSISLQIIPFIRNFYVSAGLIFVIWIWFFDANSISSCIQMKKKIIEIKKQEQFYQSEIERIKNELEELDTNKDKLEKFAREKYFFKRKGEEIFIIED